MNKITSTLAGFALVAAASIAPALAQDTGTPGNLFTPFGSGTFTFVQATGAGSGTGDGYNELGPGASLTTVPVNFTLTSSLVSGTTYSLQSLVITPTAGGSTIFTYSPTSNPLFFTYSAVAGTPTSIASLGGDNQGFTFNLVQPVPEASTVVSFGALLALGGLAVLRRKSVKNAG